MQTVQNEGEQLILSGIYFCQLDYVHDCFHAQRFDLNGGQTKTIERYVYGDLSPFFPTGVSTVACRYALSETDFSLILKEKSAK